MPLTTTANVTNYDISEGPSPTYEIPFMFFDESEIKAYIVSESEPDVQLVNPTDFTVSTPAATGTLTRVGTWPEGDRLTIVREVAIIQPTDLVNGEKINADVLELIVNRLTAVVQQLTEKTSRQIEIPITDDSGADLTLPASASRPGRQLYFNSDGDLTVGSYIDADLVSAFMCDVVGAADAAEALSLLGVSGFVQALLDDADAAEVLTSLGVSTFFQTLLDDASAEAVFSTLGVSSFIQTLLDDADASAALTTLGVSSFIQTLLDDADAETAKATLEISEGSGVMYDSEHTYSSGDICAYDGKFYLSLQAGNLGNTPDTATAWWSEYLSADTPAAFLAAISSGHNVDDTPIVFDAVEYNTDGSYDSSTGIFTAPRDGVYVFSFGGISLGTSSVTRMNLQIDDGSGWNTLGTSGGSWYQARADGTGGGYGTASVTLPVVMVAGDKARVICISPGWYQQYTWFSGFEVPKGIQGDRGPAGPAELEWNTDTTYEQNYIVTYGGVMYISLQNSNTGNQPDTATAYWDPYNFDPVLDVQIDDANYSFSASWADGPVWNAVTLPAGAIIRYEAYIPTRNDDGSWGGGYFELQYRVDGGAWQTVGNSGYSLQMTSGGNTIGSDTFPFLLDFSSRTSAFTLQFKWRFRSYSGTLYVNQNNAINSGTTPNAETGNDQFYAHQIIQQVNGVRGPVGPQGETGDTGPAGAQGISVVASAWDTGTSYASGAYVVYNGVVYVSNTDSNQGNQPDTSAEWDEANTAFSDDILPIGTILMYDGGSWVDNDTMPGWYACIAANAAQGCPDLVNKFVMGGAAAGATGGNSNITLTEGQLPSHVHNIDHDHPNGSTSNPGNHRHTEYENFSGGGSHGYIHWDQGGRGSTSYTGFSGGHTHTVYTQPYSGDSGSAGSGESIDITPPYYTVIYVRKCA